MACGDCSDPRGLCRCTIEAADASVVVVGTGEPGDPYRLSAPGAGAGTRAFDRAAIYAGSTGTYPTLPDYPHFDFYGDRDPTLISGYVPKNLDGWYRVTPDAPIALRDTGRFESASGTTQTVTLPMETHDNDIAFVIVGASNGSTVTAPSDWTHIAHANSVYTGAFFKRLTVDDAGTSHAFTGLIAPFGCYLQIYSGVGPAVLDVAGVAQSSGNTTVTSIDLQSVDIATAGSLLVSAATVSSSTAVPVPPSGMSLVNSSSGVGPGTRVASQLMALDGATGVRTWTHTPIPPSLQYSAVMFALRPAATITYFFWWDGRWVGVGGVGATGSNDYATTIGDGVHSQFNVVHPLGSSDLVVEVVDVTTGQTVWPVIRRTNDDTVLLDFGSFVPPIASKRVLISRVGLSTGSGTVLPAESNINAWADVQALPGYPTELNRVNQRIRGVDVDPDPPSLGQVLTATSPTTAEWANPTGGSSGVPFPTDSRAVLRYTLRTSDPDIARPDLLPGLAWLWESPSRPTNIRWDLGDSWTSVTD